MSIICVFCSHCWRLAYPWRGLPHVGGGAGGTRWGAGHHLIDQPCVEVRTCSVHQGLVEGGLRRGVEVPLCPLLKPLVPRLEWLVWGQPLFGGGLSPRGDTGLWGASSGHGNSRLVHVTVVVSHYQHHRESFKSWAFAVHVQELFLKRH